MTKAQEKALQEEYERRFNRWEATLDARDRAKAEGDDENVERFRVLEKSLVRQIDAMDRVLAIMGYSRTSGENETIEFIKIK